MDWMRLRQAAYDLACEAICFEDILTHPFRYSSIRRAGRAFEIAIEGPMLNKNDECIVEGIRIWFGPEFATCRIEPFKELKEEKCFEYANPKFPDNMINYIDSSITNWMIWWEVFREESDDKA